MHNVTLINTLSQRSSGILLPVFSLPSAHGIGDLGPQARHFIDFLMKCGQSCWQILPVGPTSPIFGNSPYMSFSSFSGNPLYISPDLLLEQGLLTKSDLPAVEFNEYLVDYPAVTTARETLLTRAWQRFKAIGRLARLEEFTHAHPWVADHSLFLSLKSHFRQSPWYAWPESIRTRQPGALAEQRALLAADISYHTFLQYLFFRQWNELKRYAASQGVQLIGDIPIYVALDSVDVWANQEIFDLETSGQPANVAGVPPDYFSRTGQRWGNPLYRWNSEDPQVASRLLDWWVQRFRISFSMVDLVRIDHFRGFESFWAVPAEEETAMNGSWKTGPGKPFFDEMANRLGELPIIAEDLGLITPAVEALRDELGFPGMKILLFAFDGATDNAYLPHNCQPNAVMFTGTHDNDTAVGWYLNPEVLPEVKQRAKRYANQADPSPALFHRDMVHLALSSVCNLTILPLQDVLGFGNDCRINTPGTTQDNWRWRCAPRFINDDLARWLRSEIEFFGRLPRRPSTTDHKDTTS